MKVYLQLDLSVNDFGGFRKYIAEIPAFIAKRSGKQPDLAPTAPRDSARLGNYCLGYGFHMVNEG
jgi:hypothetical protein